MKKSIKYWWTLLYFFIYITCFAFIEKYVPVSGFHNLSTAIDYKIPFIPQFIFFYIYWFPFIFWGFVRLFFNEDKTDFLKMITVLYTGMTVFIIISVIYPNEITLRPEVEVTSLSTWLTHFIYSMDTSTNVLPSIHVFNSIGMAFAINNTKGVSKPMKNIFSISAVLIILSTVFVKQHGLIDVVAGIIFAFIMCYIVYEKDIYFLKKK